MYPTDSAVDEDPEPVGAGVAVPEAEAPDGLICSFSSSLFFALRFTESVGVYVLRWIS